MTLFTRQLLNIKKRQPNVVFPLPGFIVLKDFIQRVLPAGKSDFCLASSPSKGVTTLSGFCKWVLHSEHLQKNFDSCTYTRKLGFSHKKAKVILSTHMILEKKISHQFTLAWSSLIYWHSHSFPHSHHDILDAFLKAVWEPRKNSCSPSSSTKKEEADIKVLWCLSHFWDQQSIAALLRGRGMAQQQQWPCTKYMKPFKSVCICICMCMYMYRHIMRNMSYS